MSKMEIIHDNFGNPWKLNEPTGKFELFYVEDRKYKHFRSFETHEAALTSMYHNFNHEDDRVYIFFPNGLQHEDER